MFRYWIVFAALFCSTSSFSAQVTDLYRAKADLLSQSKTDKDSAITAAMEKVLVKVAGNRELLSNPVIQKELQKHSRYMTQFNFSREEGVNKLVATFDENKIKQIFIDNNIPLWGSLRPLVLFWIVNDDGVVKTIVSETESSQLQEIVIKVADQKGLPIVLPLMDLTDTQNIQVSDLWGRFIEPIKLASQRYTPELITVIRMSQTAGAGTTPIKSLDWYMFNAKTYVIETGSNIQGEDESVVLNKAIGEITEQLAEKYALSTDSNNEMLLNVDGIDTLTKFVEVTRFLDKLSAISDVQLIKVQGTIRTFKLSFMGTQEALFTTLSLNNNFKRNNMNVNQEEPILNQQQGSNSDVNEPLDVLVTEQLVEDTIPLFYWGNQ
jgi:hypothetical protein